MRHIIILFFIVISQLSYAEDFSSLPSAECEDLNVSIGKLTACAKYGDAFSQYNLGVMYRDGINLPKDPEKAFYWLKQAAEQNMPEAQTNLGQFYQLGIGVEKNPRLAFE